MFWTIASIGHSQSTEITIYYRDYYTSSVESTLKNMSKGKDFSSMLKNVPNPDNYFKLIAKDNKSVYAYLKPVEKTSIGIAPTNVSVTSTQVKSIYFFDRTQNFVVAKEGGIFEDDYIQDTLPKINWEITTREEQVKGFQCNVAKAFYGGKELVAYFTLEIAVPIGPRLYGGLPGAILKLEITNTNQVIEAENIYLDGQATTSSSSGIFSYSIDNLPPEFLNQKYITLSQYWEMKKQMHERLMKKFNTRN